MKELIRVRVQYASRQQCCKTHKRPLPLPFTSRYVRCLFYISSHLSRIFQVNGMTIKKKHTFKVSHKGCNVYKSGSVEGESVEMETVKHLHQNFNRLDTSHVNSCIFLSTIVSPPLPLFFCGSGMATNYH